MSLNLTTLQGTYTPQPSADEELRYDTGQMLQAADDLEHHAERIIEIAKGFKKLGEQERKDASQHTEDGTTAPVYRRTLERVDATSDAGYRKTMSMASSLYASAEGLRRQAAALEGQEYEAARRFSELVEGGSGVLDMPGKIADKVSDTTRDFLHALGVGSNR